MVPAIPARRPEHRPHAILLETGRRKPLTGFDHPWQFISEEPYRMADRFYQLGIYEKVTETRCQFYELEILPDEHGHTPALQEVAGNTGRMMRPLWKTAFSSTPRTSPGASTKMQKVISL